MEKKFGESKRQKFSKRYMILMKKKYWLVKALYNYEIEHKACKPHEKLDQWHSIIHNILMNNPKDYKYNLEPKQEHKLTLMGTLKTV